MCGIAGIIHKDKSASSPAEMKGMLSVMSHRGPDAEGIWTYHGVVLGHRRLSIIDIGPEGNQPMHYDKFTIVFNGEIYNYLEIKDELKRSGHEFVTCSDTEVILHAYREWGEECVRHFRGMWALQYWIGRTKFYFAPGTTLVSSLSIFMKTRMSLSLLLR